MADGSKDETKTVALARLQKIMGFKHGQGASSAPHSVRAASTRSHSVVESASRRSGFASPSLTRERSAPTPPRARISSTAGASAPGRTRVSSLASGTESNHRGSTSAVSLGEVKGSSAHAGSALPPRPTPGARRPPLGESREEGSSRGVERSGSSWGEAMSDAADVEGWRWVGGALTFGGAAGSGVVAMQSSSPVGATDAPEMGGGEEEEEGREVRGRGGNKRDDPEDEQAVDVERRHSRAHAKSTLWTVVEREERGEEDEEKVKGFSERGEEPRDAKKRPEEGGGERDGGKEKPRGGRLRTVIASLGFGRRGKKEGVWAGLTVARDGDTWQSPVSSMGCGVMGVANDQARLA